MLHYVSKAVGVISALLGGALRAEECSVRDERASVIRHGATAPAYCAIALNTTRYV